MSLRQRLHAGLVAVGATALAARITDNEKAHIVESNPTPEEVLVVEPKAKAPKPKVARSSFWSKENRLKRVAFYAAYKGGKHRRGVPSHTQFEYVQAAETKRDRKNAKRAIDHVFAEIKNPCVNISE